MKYFMKNNYICRPFYAIGKFIDMHRNRMTLIQCCIGDFVFCACV